MKKGAGGGGGVDTLGEFAVRDAVGNDELDLAPHDLDVRFDDIRDLFDDMVVRPEELGLVEEFLLFDRAQGVEPIGEAL